MTLTLELAPGQEAEVRVRAAQSDPDADAYLAALVRDALAVYPPTPPLNPAQAADLRTRLRSFAEDWDRPDMDIYDSL